MKDRSIVSAHSNFILKACVLELVGPPLVPDKVHVLPRVLGCRDFTDAVNGFQPEAALIFIGHTNDAIFKDNLDSTMLAVSKDEKQQFTRTIPKLTHHSMLLLKNRSDCWSEPL